MIDTCVWLDTAKDPRGERLLATLRVLIAHHQVELLVPDVVSEEFSRNHDQVVASLTTSMRAHLRTARGVLQSYASPERIDELVREFDNAATRGPLIHELVVNRFNEVIALLAGGRQIASDGTSAARVVQRALEKRAPFHRSKNSVADALIAELFRGAWSNSAPDKQDHFVFVTHNTKDFSDPSDLREPHPDLADCLAGAFASYATNLEAALTRHLPAAAALIQESDFPEEPRSGQEILSAEAKLFDVIWYARSVSRRHPAGDAGRQRIEAAYDPDELGPYTDFEWGMLNGKLSALRWVLGDEWDFLDT